jgi:hypothetical protein
MAAIVRGLGIAAAAKSDGMQGAQPIQRKRQRRALRLAVTTIRLIAMPRISHPEVAFSDVNAFGEHVPELVDPETPVSVLMRSEESVPSDDRFRVMIEAVSTVLDWVFADGPHPSPAMKRLYTFVQCHAPQRLSGLPPDVMAAVFGAGREAHLARIGLLIKEPFGPRPGRRRQRTSCDNRPPIEEHS